VSAWDLRWLLSELLLQLLHLHFYYIAAAAAAILLLQLLHYQGAPFFAWGKGNSQPVAHMLVHETYKKED